MIDNEKKIVEVLVIGIVGLLSAILTKQILLSLKVK
jgi:hypothetical protein